MVIYENTSPFSVQLHHHYLINLIPAIAVIPLSIIFMLWSVAHPVLIRVWWGVIPRVQEVSVRYVAPFPFPSPLSFFQCLGCCSQPRFPAHSCQLSFSLATSGPLVPCQVQQVGYSGNSGIPTPKRPKASPTAPSRRYGQPA